MPRQLSIANKLLSLRGRMEIADGQGNQAYEARGEFSLLSPTWRITGEGREVAQVRRKIFAWVPTWVVCGELGEFKVKRKLLSWTRQYYAVGGELDGAIIKGNLFDLRFEVQLGEETIARATGRILTLRGRHNIEVIGQPELFVVIAMVILHLDRRYERQWNNDE
ncbi:hypothetical protein AACH10_13385 [Ideonella sp. DXS22W]|uniref:Uncharacterized protein n=1 Tax=Pseudaquabacterium inlustre TaxID=2984192 RepID=A0ABU9CHA6_9BURK